MDINQISFDEVDMLSLEDTKGDTSYDEPAGGLSTFVHERYKRAQDSRRVHESRWLKAFKNYRGIVDEEAAFTTTERSKVFIKVTKSKVLAAYGQIGEVLFGNNRFPLSINPTTLPEGVAESVHFDTQPAPTETQPAAPAGPTEAPMGKLLPGETLGDMKERLGAAVSKIAAPVIDKIKEGPGTTPTQVTIHPAQVAAKKMEKKIHDQLEESDANKQLRSVAFEAALLGTGIMKGPFAVDKEYPNWNAGGEYEPTIKTVPRVESVSLWNFYPDPDADNMSEASFAVERHKLSRNQLRALKRRPFFRSNEIDLLIRGGENYIPEWWEITLDDSTQTTESERFEVLEYWGFIDVDTLEEFETGIEVPKDQEEVSVNIWVAGGRVLRCVVNPFRPAYIPYYAVPYEVNPYSLFGVGIAENMEDTQALMNGFMRMSIDNAALSGNLILEIDQGNLAPGQDLDIYPGKVFVREAGAPGQAIFGTEFPNVSAQNMQMFDKARQLADESTGFPSFAHGQTGVTGVGRTASGISMLMSAANGSTRTVIKNFDDYLLAPLGKSLFRFNMQFDFDEEIKGDLEVKAEGTDSLMANEVRSQRLMQFLGVVQNPALAPFAKMDYIIREIAKSMDLDPDKVTNSMFEAAIQAELLKKFQAEQPPQAPGAPGQGAPQPQKPGAKPPAGAQASDTSGAGGGTIGTGQAPTPGEQGFSGNIG